MLVSLRRYDPNQVRGYDLSPDKRDTPNKLVRTANVYNFSLLYYSTLSKQDDFLVQRKILQFRDIRDSRLSLPSN